MENGILRQLGSIANNLSNEENPSYINIPFGKLFRILFRLTLFMSVLYLLSANAFLVCALLPGYALMLYLFYHFWLIAKRYGLRFLPVLLVSLTLNVPCAVLAAFLRNWIIGLF